MKSLKKELIMFVLQQNYPQVLFRTVQIQKKKKERELTNFINDEVNLSSDYVFLIIISLNYVFLMIMLFFNNH